MRGTSRSLPPLCPRTPPPSSSPCGRCCGGGQWRGLQRLAAARVATTSAVVAAAASPWSSKAPVKGSTDKQHWVSTVVVVVVVRTVCVTNVFIDQRQHLHLIMGRACPCGHDSCACAQGPKKSTHQLITPSMSCHLSARQRASRQPGPELDHPCSAQTLRGRGDLDHLNAWEREVLNDSGITTVICATCTCGTRTTGGGGGRRGGRGGGEEGGGENFCYESVVSPRFSRVCTQKTLGVQHLQLKCLERKYLPLQTLKIAAPFLITLPIKTIF